MEYLKKVVDEIELGKVVLGCSKGAPTRETPFDYLSLQENY